MLFGKFLDPKNDIAFKKIFGTEKNKDILIHFLNDVLVFKEKRPIVEVTFLKTIQDPEIAAKKTSIVDILCRDDKGSTYIVEMQVAGTTGFEKRAQYYASKAYCSQANIGDKYQDLKEVIFLAIADYIMFPIKKQYKSDHVILDKETYEHDLKDFSFTFIELPKFTKTVDELTTLQEKWCYFFRHAEDISPEDLKTLIGEDGIIEKVSLELDSFYWNEKELLAYEQAEKAKYDYLSSLNKKFEDGRVEERAKAELEKAEMRAKAELEKAEMQAKAELEKAELRVNFMQDMARNLRSQGVPIATILLTTNLSKEEIESL